MAADPDVATLVAELRREAEKLRARVGPTAVAPSAERGPGAGVGAGAAVASPASGGRALSDAALLATVRVADLRALAHPGEVELASHRGAIGGWVVAAKALLRRLLTPILDRQASFNRETIDALAGLERAMAAQVAFLARQLLDLEARLGAGDVAIAATAAEEGFDRRAFEAAFRGSPEQVRAAQGRYLDCLRRADVAGAVLDLGCGRGEFLRLLRDAGIAARGVELDPDLVRAARADGLDVAASDLLLALESAADASLRAVVSFQVVEHLAFWKVCRLVRLARVKLRPGGCLILESVNVQSLVTWGRAWSLDPTHRQPLHPLTLRFLVEGAGFARAELLYAGEVEPDLRLEVGEGLEARNARRLNEVLFAPQDYAVVAYA